MGVMISQICVCKLARPNRFATSEPTALLRQQSKVRPPISSSERLGTLDFKACIDAKIARKSNMIDATEVNELYCSTFFLHPRPSAAQEPHHRQSTKNSQEPHEVKTRKKKKEGGRIYS